MTTTDRLRRSIDAGATGDKVPYLDPAAAPLGTDDEAGGEAPTQADVESAMMQELRPHSAAVSGAVTNESGRDVAGGLKSESRGRLAGGLLIVGVIMVAIGLFLLATALP